MALKPDRQINAYGTDISFVFNGVADAGTIMTYGAAGSGAAVTDEKGGTVVVGPANPSGAKVAGLLVNPFVAFNPLLHRNWYKVTQFPGEKATLLRDGWVTTNVLAGGAAPDAGKPAYLGANGTAADANAGGAPVIGEFMSRLDEQGYCRLRMKL
jgi:hypothetical protein